MIDQLLKSISGELTSGLTKNYGMDLPKAEKAVGITKDSLLATITKEVGSGNMSSLLNLLNSGGNAQSSPMFSTLASSLSSSYISKLGLSKEQSQLVSTFVLPKIISAISGSKSGDFSQGDLMKMLGEGASKSLSDKAGDLLKGGLGGLFGK